MTVRINITRIAWVFFMFVLLSILQGAARAQDALGWYSWDVAPDADTESKAPPLNLAGCWGGTEQDQGGEGQLTLVFVQKGNKLVKGTRGQITFSDGRTVSGKLAGSATGTRFQVSFHRGSCNVSVQGSLPDGGPDLVGSFNFNCKPSGIKQRFRGTFDLVQGGAGC